MFKITVLKTIAIATAALFSSTVFASQEAVEQFEKAWQNPSYTQIRLNDVDINNILSAHYTTTTPVQFTRKDLWDNECKKAWDPQTYIPNVVNEAKSWGRKEFDSGDEHFTRFSQQRQWMTGEFGPVIEEVYLFNKEQKAIFLGATNTQNEEGSLLPIQNAQPLFYVEHGVAGTEVKPLNTWRIVHLTKEKDVALIERFNTFQDSTTLPKYIEVYIEKDLGISIKKRLELDS